MEPALRDAGPTPADTGVVHAHATSTDSGDLAEAEAVGRVIGSHAAVTATKSMTGHMLGASGTIGAMAALLALKNGTLPATRDLDTLDPRVEPDVVRGEPRTGRWSAARQRVRVRRPQRRCRPHRVTRGNVTAPLRALLQRNTPATDHAPRS
ncbi:hypothetical protein [Streptomyces eurythermus]